MHWAALWKHWLKQKFWGTTTTMGQVLSFLWLKKHKPGVNRPTWMRHCRWKIDASKPLCRLTRAHVMCLACSPWPQQALADGDLHLLHQISPLPLPWCLGKFEEQTAKGRLLSNENVFEQSPIFTSLPLQRCEVVQEQTSWGFWSPCIVEFCKGARQSDLVSVWQPMM